MSDKCNLESNEINNIKKELLSIDDAEKMEVLFKLFADNTRLRIIQLISLQEICVHEITALLNLSQSAVSHQLKQLRQYNLVKARRSGKHIYYSLNDDHVFKIFENVLEHINE